LQGSSLSVPIFFNTKFPETANQNILSGYKGAFDDLKKDFDCFNSFFLGKSVLGADYLDDLHFG